MNEINRAQLTSLEPLIQQVEKHTLSGCWRFVYRILGCFGRGIVQHHDQQRIAAAESLLNKMRPIQDRSTATYQLAMKILRRNLPEKLGDLEAQPLENFKAELGTLKFAETDLVLAEVAPEKLKEARKFLSPILAADDSVIQQLRKALLNLQKSYPGTAAIELIFKNSFLKQDLYNAAKGLILARYNKEQKGLRGDGR